MAMAWKIVCGVGFLFLAWAIFGPGSVEHILLRQRPLAKAPKSAESSEILQTPLRNVTVRPYDVLQNPFKFLNKVIVFDVISRPRFYDGRFYEYADGIIDPRRHFSSTGLQFHKMLSEGVGLYDIEGLDSSFSLNLGQIVVTGSNDALETDLLWEVEPLGTVQSAGYRGTAPDVPVVKFWTYVDQGK